MSQFRFLLVLSLLFIGSASLIRESRAQVLRAPSSTVMSVLSKLVRDSKTSVPKLSFYGLKSEMKVLQHSNERRLLNIFVLQEGSAMPHFLIQFGDNLESSVVNFVRKSNLQSYAARVQIQGAEGQQVLIPINRFTDRRLAQLENLVHADVQVGF